ncbi:MAG: DUF929 family protein [Chloroflexota bacterium]|nr:DUF929 family protein [Chloroflexota bacterium]
MKTRHQTQDPARDRASSTVSRVALAAAALLAVAVAAFIGANPTVAAGGSLDLGKPTSAMPQPPTGAFRRIGRTLQAHGRPELLFIGTQGDDWSAAERWPVIKALAQFGTWSGLASSTGMSGPTANSNFGAVATFDWLHAQFHSRYLTVVHKDVQDRGSHPLQRLSSLEATLLRRYAPADDPRTSATWPLVVIGNYVMHGPGLPVGYFQDNQLHNYSFDTIQSGLQRGLSGYDPLSRLVTDINQETNVEIALICHADGKKPSKVCQRGVIRHILKHVR